MGRERQAERTDVLHLGHVVLPSPGGVLSRVRVNRVSEVERVARAAQALCLDPAYELPVEPHRITR